MANENESVKKFNWKAWYMWIVYAFAFLILFPIVFNTVRAVGRPAADWYWSLIQPEQKRQIKFDKPKPPRGRRERGINITFAPADIADWVSANVPKSASDSDIDAVSNCFYDSADAIYNGRTSTPGRSISYLKKSLMKAVSGEDWENFFKELTTEVSYESFGSMEDVASMYETIGDALSVPIRQEE